MPQANSMATSHPPPFPLLACFNFGLVLDICGSSSLVLRAQSPSRFIPALSDSDFGLDLLIQAQGV